MAIFTTKTTAALIAIAMVSSLLIANGGIVGSVFAAAKKESQRSGNDNINKMLSSADQDSTDNEKSPSGNPGDLSGDIGNTHGFSAKELKKLSKCQSNAAEDGD